MGVFSSVFLLCRKMPQLVPRLWRLGRRRLWRPRAEGSRGPGARPPCEAAGHRAASTLPMLTQLAWAPGAHPPSRTQGATGALAPASACENNPGGGGGWWWVVGYNMTCFLKKTFILKALCPGGGQREAIFRNGLKKDQLLIKTKHSKIKP